MYVDSQLMPADARIWIYQANRKLTDAEVSVISERAKAFLDSWTAHNNTLKASFEIRYSIFLIIIIDKNYNEVSGCSIDKSVHFIQELEKELTISFLDRMIFAYKTDARAEVVSKKDFSQLLSSGELNDDTIVFNNLIQTKGELNTAWEVPLKDSWHRSVISH
jgi:hypothetical protein